MAPSSLRAFTVAVLITLCCGCGKSPASPSSQPALTFTFAPNPAPTSGIQVGCGGSLVPAKTWNYTLRVNNTTTTAFAVSSLTYTLTTPGGAPFTSPALDAGTVALAFGTSTVPANGSIQGSLCTTLAGASGSVSYTFSGSDGRGPFTTSSLQLQP